MADQEQLSIDIGRAAPLAFATPDDALAWVNHEMGSWRWLEQKSVPTIRDFIGTFESTLVDRLTNIRNELGNLKNEPARRARMEQAFRSAYVDHRIPLSTDPISQLANEYTNRKLQDVAGAILATYTGYLQINSNAIPFSVYPGDRSDAKQKAFVRAVLRLQELHLVGVWGEKVWLCLIARVLRLSFDTAAEIRVPAIASPALKFVSEAGPFPVCTLPTSNATMAPHKVGVIVELTRELLDGANSEALMKQALIEATGPALDLLMLSTDAAVPGLRPAGILNGVASLTATAGGGDNAMIADLQKLMLAIAGTSGNGGAVFVMDAAREIAVGKLARFSYPVLTSAMIPPATVIAISTNEIVTGLDGPPMVEQATSPVLHEEATTPLAIGTPGAPATMAAPTRSLWQTDSHGLKLRWPISWARRAPNVVAHVTGVSW